MKGKQRCEFTNEASLPGGGGRGVLDFPPFFPSFPFLYSFLCVFLFAQFVSSLLSLLSMAYKEKRESHYRLGRFADAIQIQTLARIHIKVPARHVGLLGVYIQFRYADVASAATKSQCRVDRDFDHQPN